MTREPTRVYCCQNPKLLWKKIRGRQGPAVADPLEPDGPRRPLDPLDLGRDIFSRLANDIEDRILGNSMPVVTCRHVVRQNGDVSCLREARILATFLSIPRPRSHLTCSKLTSGFSI